MNTVAHLVPSASDRENASAGAEGNAVCGQPGASRRLLSMPNGLCQEDSPTSTTPAGGAAEGSSSCLQRSSKNQAFLPEALILDFPTLKENLLPTNGPAFGYSVSQAVFFFFFLLSPL